MLQGGADRRPPSHPPGERSPAATPVTASFHRPHHSPHHSFLRDPKVERAHKRGATFRTLEGLLTLKPLAGGAPSTTWPSPRFGPKHVAFGCLRADLGSARLPIPRQSGEAGTDPRRRGYLRTERSRHPRCDSSPIAAAYRHLGLGSWSQYGRSWRVAVCRAW